MTACVEETKMAELERVPDAAATTRLVSTRDLYPAEGDVNQPEVDYPARRRAGFMLYIRTSIPAEQDVLARLPGEIIAAASQKLPIAESCEDVVREVTIEVPIHGSTVRIRFVRHVQRWRKERRWFWLADSAVRVKR
jgi:hypothetical protein